MEQFGPYRPEELLGRGGMGEVHRAFDTVRKRTVALKRLHPCFAADSEFQARFRRESELVARLTEPHVIPIHDYGEIDDKLYLDMRLVQGADLGSLLAQRGPMPPARAVSIISQMADALDAAHAEGLVHRDVKPSNILLVGGDRGSDREADRDFAYLVDFGIARSLDGSGSTALTLTGATVGTLYYMAPERFGGHVPDHAAPDQPAFDNRAFDHRVDVYSLACVLYEALTGHRPYAGEGLAVLYAHAERPIPRPSELEPGVPAALDGVIAHGMAKDPQRRYASAGALAAAARAALTTGAVPAPVGSSRPAQPDRSMATASRQRPTAHWPLDQPAPIPQARLQLHAPAPAPAPTPTRTTSVPRRRRLPVVLGVVVLFAVLAGVGWWYTRGPSPDRVLASTIAETCKLEAGQDAAGKPATYPPTLVQDGNPITAWRCNGDGAGERLVLDFGRPVEVSSIAIIPGYAKTDPTDGSDRYRQGRRLLEVSYELDGPVRFTHRLDTSPELRDPQPLAVPGVITRRILVELVSSVPGESVGGQPPVQVVAVSELIVMGVPR